MSKAWSYPTAPLFSPASELRVSALLPAFCWAGYPRDKPGREIFAQLSVLQRRQEGELMAGEDGARDTSPFPRQLQDKVVHLSPVSAPRAE